MLVQEKIAIPLQIKFGVSENLPFYQRAGANVHANAARNYAQSGCAMQDQGITLRKKIFQNTMIHFITRKNVINCVPVLFHVTHQKGTKK